MAGVYKEICQSCGSEMEDKGIKHNGYHLWRIWACPKCGCVLEELSPLEKSLDKDGEK